MLQEERRSQIGIGRLQNDSHLSCRIHKVGGRLHLVVIGLQRDIIGTIRFVPVDNGTIGHLVGESLKVSQPGMIERVDIPHDRIGYGNRRTRYIGIGRTAYPIQLVVDNRIVDNRGSIVGTDTATIIIVNEVIENNAGLGVDTATIAIAITVQGRVGNHHRVIDKTALSIGSAVFLDIDSTSSHGKVIEEQTALQAAPHTTQLHTATIGGIVSPIGRSTGNGNSIEDHIGARRIESDYRIEVVGTACILRRVERSDSRFAFAHIIVAESVARENSLVGQSPRFLSVTREHIAIYTLFKAVFSGIDQGSQVVEHLTPETAINHYLIAFQDKRSTAFVAGRQRFGGDIGTGGHPNLQRRVDVVPRIGRAEYCLQIGPLGGIGPRRTVEGTGTTGRDIYAPYVIGRPGRVDRKLAIHRDTLQQYNQQQQYPRPSSGMPHRGGNPSEPVHGFDILFVPHIHNAFYIDVVHR